MPTQTLIVNKKKYAVGLFWQPLAGATPARDYARGLGRTLDRKYDLFTEYRGMIGLGSSRDGHSAGMRVAAAEIMESFAEWTSFLAAFHVGDKFWISAVRNGVILADILFESDAAARDEFTRLAAIPEWGGVFAPASWNFPRAIERKFEETMTGRADNHLYTISRAGTNTLWFIVAGIVILGLLYFFREPIAQVFAPRVKPAEFNPELAAEYKRQIDAKKQENKIADAAADAANMPAKPEMPFDNLPDTAARADLCFNAIGFLMQPIPGWTTSSAECRETTVVATLRRDFGTILGFYQAAADIMPGAYAIENGDSEINVSADLPKLPTASSLEEKDTDTIVREVQTAFQAIDAPVSVSVKTDIVSDVVLSVVEIGAASKLTPREFMKIFDALHGVYMTAAKWTPQTRTWNYEVIIYAK